MVNEFWPMIKTGHEGIGNEGVGFKGGTYLKVNTRVNHMNHFNMDKQVFFVDKI